MISETVDVELANGNFITVDANRKIIVTDAGGNILGCWKPKRCAGTIQKILSCAALGEQNVRR